MGLLRLVLALPDRAHQLVAEALPVFAIDQLLDERRRPFLAEIRRQVLRQVPAHPLQRRAAAGLADLLRGRRDAVLDPREQPVHLRRRAVLARALQWQFHLAAGRFLQREAGLSRARQR